MSDREQALRETIDRLSRRVFAKDPGLAGDFEEDAIFVGSEADEIARGRTELNKRLEIVFGRAHTINFVWGTRDLEMDDDLAWFYADGNAVVGKDGVDRPLPYRLSGVLGWRDGAWRWRLFHGSEPAG